MKKVLLALCVILLVACTDENNDEKFLSVNNILRAHIENVEEVESRVAINGNDVYWEEDDCIGVYGSITSNVPFKYQNGQEGVAEFKGSLNLQKESVVTTYYPYNTDAEFNNKTLILQLPNEYVYKGNSNAPMLGYKQDSGTFLFKHLCGVIRITLGDLPKDAERFVISSIGEDAPAITGKAIVEDVSANNAFIVMGNEKTGKVITYHLDDLSVNDGLRHFFVPLPVGDYQNIEVALYGKESEEPYFTQSVFNLKVERATIIDIPIINGETGDNYILNSAVVELPMEIAGLITLSGTNKDVLMYGKDVPKESIPTVGQIIISKPQDNLPDGFLGRVTKSDADSEGNYIIHTEMPALTEVFDKLYVDETVPVTFQKEVEKKAKSRGILKDGIFKDIEMENKFDVNLSHKGENIIARGSFNHSGNLILNIQFDKKNKLEYCAFTWNSNAKLDVQLGVDFESENKIEGLKQILAELRGVPIPLAGGLVQLFPVYSPYFLLEGKGKIQTTMGIEAEFQPIAGALYKDGIWEQGKRSSKPQANHESPLNFKTQTKFDGEIFAGISNDFSLRLYNKEDMRIYLNPKIGLEVKGEIGLGGKIDDKLNLETIEQAKLTTSLFLSGSIGADASLLNPKDAKAELELFNFTFWEKELSAIPNFKELSSNVQPANKISYTSNVKTEMKGEVLSKDMKVELIVEDKEGNEIATSESIHYNGGKTYEEDPDVIVPLENTFDNLQGEKDYLVYPRITSPLFEGVAEDGVVNLKNKSVSFSTYNSIRDVLVKIYNDCGGENWKYKKNWCTDTPVSEWEGITILEDGTYRFDFLEQFGITGTLSIIDCNQPILLTFCEGFLDKLHLENCPNLMFAGTMADVQAKSYYINNIGGVKPNTMVTNGLNGAITWEPSFEFRGPVVEEICIKNCDTNCYSIWVNETPNLKSLICENVSLSCLSSDQLVNHDEQHMGGNIHIFDGLDKLEVIKLKNIKNADIHVMNAHSLKNLDINFKCEDYEGEVEPLKSISFASVTTDTLTVVCDSYDSPDTYYHHPPMNYHIYFFNEFTVKSVINVGHCNFYSFNDSDINFGIHGKYLKEALFYDCSFCRGLSFNGCTNLEMLTIKDSYCWGYADDEEILEIDIRNTPSLKKFDCYDVNFSKLLFDSHLNDVEARCYSRTLLQEIPDFLDVYNFEHNARYYYTYDYENDVTTFKDNGYGWWYPGEPGSGYHGRQ